MPTDVLNEALGCYTTQRSLLEARLPAADKKLARI
jgi:hypothetical protein